MPCVRRLSAMLMPFAITWLTITLVPVASAITLVPVASAQTPGAPAPAPSLPSAAPTPAGGGGGAGWLAGVVLLVWLVVIVAVVAKLVDLKNKREAEALQVQAGISNALLRDQRLATLPVVPTARAPMLKGSPITLEVCGVVPTPELREAALRVAREEASRTRPDIQVVDGLAVSPSELKRAA